MPNKLHKILAKPQWARLAAKLITVLAAVFFHSNSAHAYSELVIFGDSLSDTGNATSINLPYPFYQNRISNGPLAVDHLASALGLSAKRSNHLLGSISGSNYAVVGGNALGDDVEDLSAQINAYLNQVSNQINTNGFYLIAIGGNDIRGLRNINPANASTQINLIAERINFNARRLLDRGIKTLLIANIPDIGRTPESIADGSTTNARAHSIKLNQLIANNIAQLNASYQTEIKLFDFYTYFNTILANVANHGFSYTTVGCYTAPFHFHSACNLGSRFDRFVFFDSIHPSANTHALLGTGLINAANTPAGIPASKPSIEPIWLLLLLD